MADSDSIPSTKTCTKCGETKPIEAFRKWHRTCLSCAALLRHIDRANNPEKYQQLDRKNRNTYKEKRRLHNKTWENNNRLSRTLYKKAYKAKNRAYFAVHESTRRAQKRNAPVQDFTLAQWQMIQALQKHRCYYCGKRCKDKLTQDHIVPLSKGGAHTLSNIVGACGACNSKKNDGPPLYPVQPLLL